VNTLLQQEMSLPVLPPSCYQEWINARREDGLQEQVLVHIFDKLQEAESIETSEVGVLWKGQKLLVCQVCTDSAGQHALMQE
jgi:hypothetical protein